MFSLRRNIAYNVKPKTKLSPYKSLVLPIVTYGLFCAKQSKITMNALERLQKKAVKWIMGNKQTCYANSLRLLNLLPLPMFGQMNDLLLFSSLTRGNLANILNLHTKVTCSARRPMNYQMKLPWSERSRSEFFFRNCQTVNKVNNCFDIGNGTLVSKTDISAICGDTTITSSTKTTLVHGYGCPTVDNVKTWNKGVRTNLGAIPSVNS